MFPEVPDEHAPLLSVCSCVCARRVIGTLWQFEHLLWKGCQNCMFREKGCQIGMLRDFTVARAVAFCAVTYLPGLIMTGPPFYLLRAGGAQARVPVWFASG